MQLNGLGEICNGSCVVCQTKNLKTATVEERLSISRVKMDAFVIIRQSVIALLHGELRLTAIAVIASTCRIQRDRLVIVCHCSGIIVQPPFAHPATTIGIRCLRIELYGLTEVGKCRAVVMGLKGRRSGLQEGRRIGLAMANHISQTGTRTQKLTDDSFHPAE